MGSITTAAHISGLRSSMEQAIALGVLEQINAPLDHYHTRDLYARRIYVPAGATVVTAVHKSEHITIALTGHCVVVDEIGDRKDVIAPAVFVTKPGTQRAVYAITDTQWVTVHCYQDADKAVETIEKSLVCDNMDLYNNLFLEASS